MEVKGFPYYFIYPDGRVYSEKSNKFLKHNNDGNGYLFVRLKTNKKVHRLVAEHYIPNPENKREVDHIDRDKNNNRVENLRWVSSKENCKNRNPKRVQKNNKLGHKNISFTNNKTYKFLIQRKGVYVNKTFKTLTDALCYKFYFLLSHRKYLFG
jgi:hypothetical protein